MVLPVFNASRDSDFAIPCAIRREHGDQRLGGVLAIADLKEAFLVLRNLPAINHKSKPRPVNKSSSTDLRL